MDVEVVGGIGQIDAKQWNLLSGQSYPFLRHEFMLAAEEAGCVSAESGWTPLHLAIFRNGQLRAAMPLYEKSHSWGEFVFDWAWANAYQRAGLAYYPKLVSASPFTPAQSPRLLLADAGDTEAAEELVEGALNLAAELGHSSLHVQFPLSEELPTLAAAGLKLRKDCQFHWHNQNYRSFEDFLATFSSAKRKKVRRDRRHVREVGIRFRWLSGAELSPSQWQAIYELISVTFLQRGSLPYLNHEFFCTLSETCPDNVVAVVAERRGDPIAAAVCYRSPTALYGRYWGASAHYNALHFETCYYQGIEYCIRHGLSTFEPGTQGEHKISRGFSPVTTWSAHWLQRSEFFAAIGDYLDEESDYIERYIDAVRRHSPYRSRTDGSAPEEQ